MNVSHLLLLVEQVTVTGARIERIGPIWRIQDDTALLVDVVDVLECVGITTLGKCQSKYRCDTCQMKLLNNRYIVIKHISFCDNVPYVYDAIISIYSKCIIIARVRVVVRIWEAQLELKKSVQRLYYHIKVSCLVHSRHSRLRGDIFDKCLPLHSFAQCTKGCWLDLPALLNKKTVLAWGLFP